MKRAVTISGTKELQRKLKQMSVESRGHLLDIAVEAGAEVIRTQAVLNAPAKSGDLRRSLSTEKTGTYGFGVWFHVGSNLVYARKQELGGVIRPKNGPFLVFEVDGRLVFARKVKLAAQPYLRPAYDEKRDEAVQVIGRAFEAAVIRKHLL